MSSYVPGDVKIKILELENRDKKIKYAALDQLDSFNIYEDITKPTVYAEFSFVDNVNLIDNMPIIGEEHVTIIFETPGISQPTKYVLRCFEIKDLVRDANQKGARYTLRCVSEEHLKNGSATVMTSMNDTIDKMVHNILKNTLRSEKDFILDETKGIQVINFPYMNPLKAIDMLRQRAVSKAFASSVYVFFENQSGFNFKTVESLIKEGKKNLGSRSFITLNNPEATPAIKANAFRTIQAYELLSNADANQKIAEGMFKSITKTFDLDAKKVESKTATLNDVMGAFTSINKKEMPNTDTFIEKATEGLPKQFFTIKDTTRPDQFIDAAMAGRNSFAVMMNANVLRIKIHGDSGLKAGDIIHLTLPSPSGQTKKSEDQSTGYYLITRLRHNITAGDKPFYQMSCDVARMM
ncbi:hypothetical protein EBT25_07290 [bacterium]|jgi:hypothetical protein|nr:hypothetical protein [bacterium]